MPARPPFVFAILDDVHVRRDDRGATIELGGRTVRLELGAEARALTDQDIVDRWNQRVLALAHGFDETELMRIRLVHLLRRGDAHVCLVCIDDGV